MSDYDASYDPKYGYNRNAFAHGTVGTAIMGCVVKIIATAIGLVSEAIHARRDKRRPSSDVVVAGEDSNALSGSGSNKAVISNQRQVE